MSLTETSAAEPTEAAVPELRVRKFTPGAWFRLALACVVVAASGGVRLWQAGKVDAALEAGRQSPFPLEQIPTTLKSWKGETTEMDEKIVRATGSTDRITRRYVDQRTGVNLDVIVLYGPTSDMFIHSPELCYPKAGFHTSGDARSCRVPVGKGTVPFRSLVFAKGEGGHTELQEIYYSWRYNGRWTPNVSSPKESQRIPGMYKVQIARRVFANENLEHDNPAEAFLEVLIPELERRFAGEPTGPTTAS